VAFGVVVIVSFGTWFYGYGVLVEPIIEETGWSESLLSTAYGLGLLAGGLGAILVGRLADRTGAKRVFAMAALGSAVGTAVVATAPVVGVFTVAAILTNGIVGAAGYYSLIHATIARLAPAARHRAITTNTLWGAFASPVFLPLMAWLALSHGWRSAVAITGALVAGAFAAAAVLVPAGPPAPQGPHPSLLSGLGDAWRQRAIRLLLVAVFLGGVVTSVLFLYQVPTMVEAGLLLTTASALAGARGLFQLAGRLPLPWLVDRFGARLVLRLSLALIGSSSLLLLVSGHIIPAAAFIVLGGISVGAFTTLENIYATEVIDPSMFGTLLGLYSLVRGLGAALGPSGAGALTDLTSTRAWALVSIAVLAAVGGLLIPRRTSPS